MSAAPDYVAPDPTPLESSLAFLAAAITDVAQATTERLESDDTGEAAALLLRDLREQRIALAALESYVEAETARRLDKGKHEVAGLQVEVRGGSAWKDWRNDELAWALTRPLAADPATGEVSEHDTELIDKVRSVLLNCARPSWRLTQLATYGINPRDFATYTPGRRTVQITEAGAEQ